MPVMDGGTAIREIRAWETAQKKLHVPVIVLTAHDLLAPEPGAERTSDGEVMPAKNLTLSY